MSEDKPYRIVESAEADGVKFELCQYYGSGMAMRQIKATLSGGTALFEPGAMQWYKGDISASVVKHDESKGFMSRMINSSGTGESAYATSFTGTGEFWAEPTDRHFLIGEMDAGADGKDALVLNDRAFYACSGGVKLRTFTHKDVMSGVTLPNGFMQPMLTGKGAFVVESPVPEAHLEVVELNGGKLVVDGDFLLMHTQSVKPRIGTLVRGLRNSHRSGEGFVYHFEGYGTVWLMPTLRMT